MARYTGPKCRLSRRIGMNLELKGKRLEMDKSRGLDVVPGGRIRRFKLSSYGEQLLEKQKVKWFYGVLEKQFRRYFQMASGTKGNTGEELLVLFERRLDNAVFKIGLASTRAQARQFVTHGHITVNGKKVSIPSYLVKKDDVIGVSKKEKTQKLIKASLEESKGRAAPSWIVVDGQELTGKILSFPVREDISLPVNEQLIVELLSR